MNGILVDSSVWAEHFKRPNAGLLKLIAQGRVRCHPLIVGEVACGTPPNRLALLRDLNRLPTVRQATLREVFVFIERESVFGRGVGLIDVMLLASARITPGIEVFTLDKRLAAQAERFDILYRPPEA